MGAPRMFRKLIQPDGAVLIPARLAEAILAVLTIGLQVLVRRNELGRLSPQMVEVLQALQVAASRAPDTDMSASGPASGADRTLAASRVEMLTVAEAALICGCSARHIRRLINQGHLPAGRRGRDWLIDSRDLDTYRFGPKGDRAA